MSVENIENRISKVEGEMLQVRKAFLDGLDAAKKVANEAYAETEKVQHSLSKTQEKFVAASKARNIFIAISAGLAIAFVVVVKAPASKTASAPPATLEEQPQPKKQETASVPVEPPVTMPAPKVDATIDNWDKLTPLERQSVVYKSCPDAKWPEDTGLEDNWAKVALEKFNLTEAQTLIKTCDIGLILAKAKVFAKKEIPVAGAEKPLCRGVAECGKPKHLIKLDVRGEGKPYHCDPNGTYNPNARGTCGSLKY
jgi:hypothetical protein